MTAVIDIPMFSRLLLLLLLTCGWSAKAHDPYEIVSTAYLRGDRLDVEVLMEFSAAALLAGEDARSTELEPTERFLHLQPQLQKEAAEFFRVVAGDEALPLTSATVTLGVEDHVRFNLTFPAPPSTSLRFDAPGLGLLEDSGPYGTTLTVLDMVNSRVLGQNVLRSTADAAVIEDLVPPPPPSEHAAGPATAPVADTASAVSSEDVDASEGEAAGQPAAGAASSQWLLAVSLLGSLVMAVVVYRALKRPAARAMSL